MGQYGYQSVQGNASLGDISAVVASLPAGVSLGDVRVSNGVYYKLVYNAGGSQISKGFYATPIPGVSAGGGAYSVTITTLSDSLHHVGAVVCHHATSTTGTYFWGAFKGTGIPMVHSTTLASGAMAMCGAAGKIATAPSLPTEVVSNAKGRIVVMTTGDTGAVGGTHFINFE